MLNLKVRKLVQKKLHQTTCPFKDGFRHTPLMSVLNLKVRKLVQNKLHQITCPFNGGFRDGCPIHSRSESQDSHHGQLQDNRIKNSSQNRKKQQRRKMSAPFPLQCFFSVVYYHKIHVEACFCHILIGIFVPAIFMEFEDKWSCRVNCRGLK